MATPSEALFISIPTTIFSFCSFWAALYICISCWFMKRLHDRRFNANSQKHKTSKKQSLRSSRASSIRSYASSPIAIAIKATDPISTTIPNKYSTTSDQFISNFIDENVDGCWERPQLIMHHIKYMAAFDSLLALVITINYAPQILFGSNYCLFSLWNELCYVSGIVFQFAFCGSVIWYFVVGYNLFRIVFGLNQTNFDKIKKSDSIFAWSVIIICVIVPIPTNNYGECTANTICWINNELYQLCLYIPVAITFVFAVFLLISVVIKWYKNNENDRCSLFNVCCLKTDYIFGGVSVSDSEIASRLTAFSLVFIFVWSVPIINYVYIILMNDRDIWLNAISQYTVALIGTANCFIWSRSKNFRPWIYTYRDLVELEYENTRKVSVNPFNI